ncbi:PQQ-dependent sugar dehydrogenase [Sedimentitalea sp. HM32M-2]|uniref:PQQ-dependent sugar dehydrogenase n=1 Tax=Sedimentitalea sp. HM32M-2 TaxID=3351566 RepID=UPI00363BC762
MKPVTVLMILLLLGALRPAWAQNAAAPIRVQADASAKVVAQDGRAARALRTLLRRIVLPPGFRIELYAMVPNARQMAISPDGKVVFVGTRRGQVWAVADRDRDGTADAVTQFAPAIRFDKPNGVAVAGDGTLFVAERNRVLMFPDAAAFRRGTDFLAIPIVPQGTLIPPVEESRNHSARVIEIGPGGRLYISLGQPYNVSPPEKLALYERTGIGGIIRMNRDGSGREVHTRGVRNSVGMDFHPETGELWFTDNQVDLMGDDIPPGEINRQTAPGQHFGFPWYGGGSVRTHEYADQPLPKGMVLPASETVAHAADLGMSFYTGDMFPARYRNAIFSAQHGSWNRTQPIGARVMVSFVDMSGRATTRPFAEGWLNADGGYDGRPVDVLQMPDGALLVSDDFAGALYRISYAP